MLKLSFKNWKVTAYGKFFENRILTILHIDAESFEILKQKKFEIRLGLRTVIVKVIRSNLQTGVEMDDNNAVTLEQIQNKEVLFVSKNTLREAVVQLAIWVCRVNPYRSPICNVLLSVFFFTKWHSGWSAKFLLRIDFRARCKERSRRQRLFY